MVPPSPNRFISGSHESSFVYASSSSSSGVGVVGTYSLSMSPSNDVIIPSPSASDIVPPNFFNIVLVHLLFHISLLLYDY